MDIFDSRCAKAMLAGREEEAFDSPEYLFELKLDGERCFAYLDPDTGTELINKRGRAVLDHYPELADVHKQVRQRCILDGELVIGSGLKREIWNIRSRLRTSNPQRIQRMARETPASFVAFDILYVGREPVIKRPLIGRKKLLADTVTENSRFIVTRYIENNGAAFYDLVVEQDLEGVVAKRKDSVYLMGKRADDWVKFKNWVEDDFVVCGY